MSQSIRSCDRCIGTRKDGTRCRRRTCIGTCCWQHAMKNLGLRVKKSLIPGAGRGLFSARVFRRNDRIVPYVANDNIHMNRSEIDAKYGNALAEYVFCHRNYSMCWDASKTNSGVARFANDPRGAKVTANAKIVKLRNSGNSPPCLIATRKINPGEEIYVSYGSQYW